MDYREFETVIKAIDNSCDFLVKQAKDFEAEELAVMINNDMAMLTKKAILSYRLKHKEEWFPATAHGMFLDAIAFEYGIPRKLDESDEDLRKAVIEIFERSRYA